jgi:hypothetical protein
MLNLINTSFHLDSDKVDMDFQQQGKMDGEKDLKSSWLISQYIMQGGVALSKNLIILIIMG